MVITSIVAYNTTVTYARIMDQKGTKPSVLLMKLDTSNLINTMLACYQHVSRFPPHHRIKKFIEYELYKQVLAK